MPVSLTIDTDSRVLRRQLRQLRAALVSDEEIGATIGFAGEALFKRHLIEEGYVGRINALGGTSTGFWRSVHDSIGNEPAGDASAIVYVLHRGYRLRLEGGEVRPVTRKALSIPVHPSAHGLNASEYPQPLIYISDDAGATVAGLWTKGEDGTLGDLIYVLRTKTTHPADPEAAPHSYDWFDVISDALGDLIDAATEST